MGTWAAYEGFKQIVKKKKKKKEKKGEEEKFIRFALLGFGIGALYSLASQGLMVIYRGSGVLNFAHGAIGMVGAYVEWEVHGQPDWPSWRRRAASPLSRLRLIGALTHLLIMRPLRTASPLARIVATLGVLIVLQSGAVLRYGSTPRSSRPSCRPTVMRISGES